MLWADQTVIIGQLMQRRKWANYFSPVTRSSSRGSQNRWTVIPSIDYDFLLCSFVDVTSLLNNITKVSTDPQKGTAPALFQFLFFWVNKMQIELVCVRSFCLTSFLFWASFDVINNGLLAISWSHCPLINHHLIECLCGDTLFRSNNCMIKALRMCEWMDAFHNTPNHVSS